jgi:tRNA (guanosine-2'-O-)-methyltransferase
VVGHEVQGVRPEILALADHVVEIPMAGAKHSLNVAVSFGVLAFAIRRQWLARNLAGGTP